MRAPGEGLLAQAQVDERSIPRTPGMVRSRFMRSSRPFVVLDHDLDQYVERTGRDHEVVDVVDVRSCRRRATRRPRT